jgi:gluconolactonase
MVATAGLKGDFEVHDERFRYLLQPNAWVERVYHGTLWSEGPVYFADGDFLVWSDIPNDRMLRYVEGLGVTLFRHPANNSNGNTRDRQGRLVSCEHGARRVSRTEHDGSITVLVDSYKGKRLNSPNDVVVKSDDSVWFTDPPYGILSDYEGHKNEPEYGGANVFRLDPKTGKLTVLADDFDKPNGIAFSPDEKKIYIVDTGASHKAGGNHHIRVFDVVGGSKLGKGRVFAEISPGIADGLRIDTDGNVWTSAGDGIQCFSPDGKLLGKIRIPEPVSNLTFGGPKRNRLFITATTSLYACYVAQNGAQRP